MAVKKKAPKRVVKARTFVNIILDESGSMVSAAGEPISGYNNYIEELKKQAGTFLITLTKFHTITKVMCAAVPLSKAPLLTTSNYQPSGFTALYDAIGKTVGETYTKIRKTDRVLNVIITDGEENASREFTKSQIEALVKECEAKGNWTFTYLSAAPSAFRDAASLGIAQGNTVSYQPTAQGTQHAMNRMSAATMSFSQSPVASTKSFYSPDPVTPPDPPALKARRRKLV